MQVNIHKVKSVECYDMVFDGFVTRTLTFKSAESNDVEIRLFAENLEQFEMLHKGVTHHDY